MIFLRFFVGGESLMETLKTQSGLNSLQYILLKRNEAVALYGTGGTYTDEILHREVDIIYVRQDKYDEREAIPCNEQSGRDRCRCFATGKSVPELYTERKGYCRKAFGGNA